MSTSTIRAQASHMIGRTGRADGDQPQRHFLCRNYTPALRPVGPAEVKLFRGNSGGAVCVSWGIRGFDRNVCGAAWLRIPIPGRWGERRCRAWRRRARAGPQWARGRSESWWGDGSPPARPAMSWDSRMEPNTARQGRSWHTAGGPGPLAPAVGAAAQGPGPAYCGPLSPPTGAASLVRGPSGWSGNRSGRRIRVRYRQSCGGRAREAGKLRR